MRHNTADLSAIYSGNASIYCVYNFKNCVYNFKNCVYNLSQIHHIDAQFTSTE